MRGFGQAPTNYMIEMSVDAVARHLQLDRLDVRRRNLIKADECPYQIPTGSKYDSGDYHTVLNKGLDLAGYDNLLNRRDRARAAGRPLRAPRRMLLLSPGDGREDGQRRRRHVLRRGRRGER